MAEADPKLTVEHPKLTAAVKLLRNTGALSVSFRYSDDEEPVVWFTVVEHRVDEEGRPVAEGGEQRYSTAAAFDPLTATLRLLEQIVDGGHCAHCLRPAGFEPDSLDTMPFNDEVCWYQWDPEMKVFRRACEGDAQAPGRNEPCHCGSGRKFKKCHGA